jgi:uncharacterized protein (TIGR02147 family)
MLKLAANTLDAVPRDERDVSSVTLTLTAAAYKDVRNRIERFRHEILDAVENGATPEECGEVYQLNIQLFPLTRREVT